MKKKKPFLIWNIEDDEILRRQHSPSGTPPPVA